MRNLILILLLVFQGIPIIAVSQSQSVLPENDSNEIKIAPGSDAISFAYTYGFSGEDFYGNPVSITQFIQELGYNDKVTDDLMLAGDLWQHYVKAHHFFVEYEFPTRSKNTGFVIGGMFRREFAERYAEVFYNPPYTFSGIDMSAYGGGLYVGISQRKNFGKAGAFIQGSLGYFNFSREYLYSFYLDPQQAGYPISSSYHEKVFASGPGALVKAGISYSIWNLGVSPIINLILMKDELKYGGISAGMQVSYRFK